jgi:hypothetical protein
MKTRCLSKEQQIHQQLVIRWKTVVKRNKILSELRMETLILRRHFLGRVVLKITRAISNLFLGIG